MKIGAVAIGRNEGERLRLCLRSLAAVPTVYVDSGSTDGSLSWVRQERIATVELDRSVPFTAARARNAGFCQLRHLAPDTLYVQFVDGDCELIEGWLKTAASFLDSHPDVSAVCGRLRERYPERSIYNWLCQREWDGPTGEVRACGGIAMIRGAALRIVGGFREDLIAGEEPELCVRLRQAGWRVWRLDSEMAMHDAAMMRFEQWWRRALRGGYAYAQGAYLHGASLERHWVWESRRAWFWGIWLPAGCLVFALIIWPWGCACFLIYPLQLIRQVVRTRGQLRERFCIGFFQILARFPEGVGQLLFWRDRLLGRQTRLIEHK
jgi:GT2 family glycosyltransferase